MDITDFETIQGDVTNIQSNITNIESDVQEITTALDSKLDASEFEQLLDEVRDVYHYRGSVATIADLDLIEDPAEGDVYNVEENNMNYAWTGTEWDSLGGLDVDLTNYLREEDVDAISIPEINAILFGGKSAVVSALDGMQAMIANNEAIVTISVKNDIDAESEPIEIPSGKTVTLKLGDSEITGSGPSVFRVQGNLILEGGSISSAERTIYVGEGGSLTVNGTDIDSTASNAINTFGEGATVTINDGNITAQEYGVLVMHGGSVVVNGGYLVGKDNFGIGGNGSAQVTLSDGTKVNQLPTDVTINGGTIEGRITSPGYIATAIYWPNAGILTINNGTIISDGAGIVQRAGTVNIVGGTITASGETGVKGKAGDSKITVGPYAVVFDKSANYPNSANMELNLYGDAVLSGTDGEIDILPSEASTDVHDYRPAPFEPKE